MQPHEKEIILREIKKWRQSRLLPKEYCDFLMNLYLCGEQTAAQVSATNAHSVGKSGIVKQGFRAFLWALVLTVCIGIIIQFRHFSFSTQAIIVGNAIGLLIILAILTKKHLFRLLSLFLMAILIIVEAYITDQAFAWPLHSLNGTAAFFLAFCIWVIIGTIGRSKWVSGLGLGMVVLFLNWFILRYSPAPSTYLSQHIYAVGLACLLGFCSRIAIHQKAKTAIVWVFATVFSAFLPDINQWMNGQPLLFEWEGILFLKILLLTGMGIVWRNRLYSWWQL